MPRLPLDARPSGLALLLPPPLMSLVPLDVVVALALSQVPDASYPRLAALTGTSPGSLHASVARLVRARLVTDDVVPGLPGRRRVIADALGVFLVGGVPFLCPATLGPLDRGVALAALGVPAAWRRVAGVVWPTPDGGTVGPALVPLIPRVAHLIQHAPALARLLALLDVVRLGPSLEATSAGDRLADAVRPSSRVLR